MNDKKNIIIFIVLIVLLVGFVVFIKSSTKKADTEVNTELIDISYDSNEEYVISFLKEMENRYIEGLQIKSDYSRRDFYNAEYMNAYTEDCYIEFVNISDIDAYKMYNENGEEIEDFPQITYEEKEVEISNKNEFAEGNYYLIRYAPDSDNYVYYYVTQLTSSGFEKIDFYITTFGEAVGIMSEELEMESEIEE